MRPDLEVDFANEDDTGYIWTWLDEVGDAARATVGSVRTVSDGTNSALTRVVDRTEIEGTAQGKQIRVDPVPRVIILGGNARMTQR